MLHQEKTKCAVDKQETLQRLQVSQIEIFYNIL